MVVAVILERRVLLGADRLGDRAAGAEAAAGRRVDRARHVTREHDPGALAARDGLRVGREEGHRVRVQRPGEELVRGRDLDDAAQVHHGDAVGDVADDREVVGDEDVGEVELLLEVDEQVEHLRLDRDVERRDGLVGDDELRLQHERAREADALPLAAAELVRIAVGGLGRHADALEHLVDDRVALLPRGEVVDAEALGDQVADLHPRVERPDRVLEDDLHVLAHLLHALRRERDEVDAVELDLAGGGLEEPEDACARGSTCRSRTRRRGRRSRRGGHRGRRRRRPGAGRWCA